MVFMFVLFFINILVYCFLFLVFVVMCRGVFLVYLSVIIGIFNKEKYFLIIKLYIIMEILKFIFFFFEFNLCVIIK